MDHPGPMCKGAIFKNHEFVDLANQAEYLDRHLKFAIVQFQMFY